MNYKDLGDLSDEELYAIVTDTIDNPDRDPKKALTDNVVDIIRERVGEIQTADGSIMTIAVFDDRIPFAALMHDSYLRDSDYVNEIEVNTVSVHIEGKIDAESEAEEAKEPETAIEIMLLFIRLRSRMKEIGFSSFSGGFDGYNLLFSKTLPVGVEVTEELANATIDDIEKVAAEFKEPFEKYVEAESLTEEEVPA